jgi:trafficking protein particle complex subunit 12
MPSKDFSFLQDPAAYHVLPSTNVATPFLNAPNAPPVSSPIESLLHSGHYRLAAIAAARNIVQAAAPTDYSTLLHLLHVRLACLCLISDHALAAQESKVLGDLNSAFYRHPLTNAHLVPWDLRLLVVRLAALGYGEWRKGIMGYYELARECRENIIKAETDEDKALWQTRLRDCGVRVANVLVEMGDLEGAGQHLSTLSAPEAATDTPEARQLFYMETLVWLRVGDIKAARRCLSSLTQDSSEDLLSGTLTALLHLSNADYDAAVSTFTTLHQNHPSDAMVTQNLAVCLLYTGQISTARALLIELVDTSPPFHSMIFNICTIFELCTERNRERKLALAEKLAKRRPHGDALVGWEVGASEFKL